MKIYSKMEQDSQDVEQVVTLCFEGGKETTQYKSFLIDHSFYFEAMFGGSFMETRLNRILIQVDKHYVLTFSVRYGFQPKFIPFTVKKINTRKNALTL